MLTLSLIHRWVLDRRQRLRLEATCGRRRQRGRDSTSLEETQPSRATFSWGLRHCQGQLFRFLEQPLPVPTRESWGTSSTFSLNRRRALELGHSNQQEEVKKVTAATAIPKSSAWGWLSSVLRDRPRRTTPFQLCGKCTCGPACRGHSWLATHLDDEALRRQPGPRILLRGCRLPWQHDDGGQMVEESWYLAPLSGGAVLLLENRLTTTTPWCLCVRSFASTIHSHYRKGHLGSFVVTLERHAASLLQHADLFNIQPLHMSHPGLCSS